VRVSSENRTPINRGELDEQSVREVGKNPKNDVLGVRQFLEQRNSGKVNHIK